MRRALTAAAARLYNGSKVKKDAVSEMIFDFISGEASTQEGGEKFTKWLAEDTDLTKKKRSPLWKRSRTSLQRYWTR